MSYIDKDSLERVDAIKSVLDNYRPFHEHVVKQLRDYYRIGLTYTSNAIEGNTLTESETRVVIEDGLTIGGKSLREHFEVIGHARSYDHIYSLMNSPVSEEDLLYLHKLFFQQIDSENAGRYRQKNVIITGTDFIPPDYHKVPALMKRVIENINIVPADKHPIEWASNLHAEFESIHPFIDGNGRIGRLLLSISTMKYGYCPVIIPPVRRSEYITAMQRANKGDLYMLSTFILSVIYEEMKSLKRIVENLCK
ncbi:MAG TPA: cell filamentation protein Fic [Nitrospiraceae bacterium]|nr:cell filamentation protein Fic [Nitrospiraceae bacterium]HKZ56470.1 Fic family protein [Thermodesulfovibrionales bacterium]